MTTGSVDRARRHRPCFSACPNPAQPISLENPSWTVRRATDTIELLGVNTVSRNLLVVGEMFRELTAFVTAAAMLWHAVVGCCAHHNHETHACATKASCKKSSHDAPEGRGCCHGGANAPASSVDSPGTTGKASHTSPCPPPSPKRCTERTCVLGIPSKSGPLHAGSLPSNWIVVAFFVIDSTRELLAAHGPEYQPSRAPPPFGGLRTHLALSVLTL